MPRGDGESRGNGKPVPTRETGVRGTQRDMPDGEMSRGAAGKLCAGE